MAFLDEKSKSEKLYRIIFSQKYQNNDKTAKKMIFLPKNDQTNSTLLLVDLFSFLFWKRVKTSKRHLEID